MLEVNKIYNADCLEFIDKYIDDESLDAVITDPPYGDNEGYGRNNKTILNNESEEINYKVIPLLYKKLKNDTSCYLFTNWKFEHKLRNFIENETDFNIRMLICIVKNNIGMGYGFRNQHEFCIVIEKGNPKYNSNDFSNVMKMQHINHNEDTHPHEKGIKLFTDIIKHSTKKNDLILDCFSGSGTLAIAAHSTNRNFICIELDENYYQKSVTRYNKAIGGSFKLDTNIIQNSLFTP